MPSQDHARLCFILAVCVSFFIFVTYLDHFEALGAHVRSTTTVHQAIQNSTLGFEKIFAINAPWRTDRKDSLTLALAESGISVEWIEGVNASDIDERAFPQGDHRSLPRGNLGSWRAHMNAIRAVIEGNLSTALIIEDDVDWNSRLRQQLTSFGHASHLLPDLLGDAEKAREAHVPATESPTQSNILIDSSEVAKRSTLPLPAPLNGALPAPYGRDWDVLWLGHCDTQLPPTTTSAHPTYWKDRIALYDDPSIPASSTSDTELSPYPPQTRIYHPTHRTLCTLAYAITLRGARRTLYEHGMRNMNKGYDFALSEWCDGKVENSAVKPVCLTSSPSIMGHYWPMNGEGGGGKGDITGIGGDGLKKIGSLGSAGVRANLRTKQG